MRSAEGLELDAVRARRFPMARPPILPAAMAKCHWNARNMVDGRGSAAEHIVTGGGRAMTATRKRTRPPFIRHSGFSVNRVHSWPEDGPSERSRSRSRAASS